MAYNIEAVDAQFLGVTTRVWTTADYIFTCSPLPPVGGNTLYVKTYSGGVFSASIASLTHFGYNSFMVLSDNKVFMLSNILGCPGSIAYGLYQFNGSAFVLLDSILVTPSFPSFHEVLTYDGTYFYTKHGVGNWYSNGYICATEYTGGSLVYVNGQSYGMVSYGPAVMASCNQSRAFFAETTVLGAAVARAYYYDGAVFQTAGVLSRPPGIPNDYLCKRVYISRYSSPKRVVSIWSNNSGNAVSALHNYDVSETTLTYIAHSTLGAAYESAKYGIVEESDTVFHLIEQGVLHKAIIDTSIVYSDELTGMSIEGFGGVIDDILFTASSADSVIAFGGPLITAEFSASTEEGFQPLGVEFIDESIGAITSWLWDFGDGQTSTVQNPSHVYSNPGWYTVKLTVTDGLTTAEETKVDFITVHIVASLTKYNFITIYPTLKTLDYAPPVARPERILVARGPISYLLSEDTNAIRVYIRSDEEDLNPAGFNRGKGPSVVFD
ncbi:MAG: PKD domain-containing protein [Dehalococcoidia bacterium]|nr:MAG: PKD domain-containing protein [Dehalococcoidia bacterium]